MRSMRLKRSHAYIGRAYASQRRGSRARQAERAADQRLRALRMAAVRATLAGGELRLPARLDGVIDRLLQALRTFLS